MNMMEGRMAWLADPVVFGDYSPRFRSIVSSYYNYNGLRSFSAAERASLKGSVDFIGLNFYSSQ